VEDQAIILAQSFGPASSSTDQMEMWSKAVGEIYESFQSKKTGFSSPVQVAVGQQGSSTRRSARWC